MTSGLPDPLAGLATLLDFGGTELLTMT